MTIEDTQKKRKRLIFRSWHRGTREMDLIMGTFADSCVESLSAQELDLYDQLLETPDPDLYDWVSGRKDVPAEHLTPVMSMLLEHHVASNLIKSNAKAH
jgi:antitoxin CptB